MLQSDANPAEPLTKPTEHSRIEMALPKHLTLKKKEQAFGFPHGIGVRCGLSPGSGQDRSQVSVEWIMHMVFLYNCVGRIQRMPCLGLNLFIFSFPSLLIRSFPFFAFNLLPLPSYFFRDLPSKCQPRRSMKALGTTELILV